jgi:integrase
VSYLRWDQVDLDRSMAWIHADQAKARRAIAVPLNRDAESACRRQLGVHPEYVFTYQGRPVERTSTKAWKSALRRAGIANFRWHDLRHTWASWHVQSATTLQELMELGGWSSYEMVLRYAHLAGEHLKGAAGRIERGLCQSFVTDLAQSNDTAKVRLIVSN